MESDNPKMTLKQVAQLAIDLQNACNLSGVVHSFSRVMHTIWAEVHEGRGQGTEFVNTHPIVIMFVSKLADLCGYGGPDVTSFGKAYDTCKALAKGS